MSQETCTHRNRPHEAHATGTKYCPRPAGRNRLVLKSGRRRDDWRSWDAWLCNEHLAYYIGLGWEVNAAPVLSVVRP